MASASSPPRLISDELWALAEPLIPPRPPAMHGRTGRPRTADREVLEGIAFVLSGRRHHLELARSRALAMCEWPQDGFDYYSLGVYAASLAR